MFCRKVTYPNGKHFRVSTRYSTMSYIKDVVALRENSTFTAAEMNIMCSAVKAFNSMEQISEYYKIAPGMFNGNWLLRLANDDAEAVMADFLMERYEVTQVRHDELLAYCRSISDTEFFTPTHEAFVRLGEDELIVLFIHLYHELIRQGKGYDVEQETLELTFEESIKRILKHEFKDICLQDETNTLEWILGKRDDSCMKYHYDLCIFPSDDLSSIYNRVNRRSTMGMRTFKEWAKTNT